MPTADDVMVTSVAGSDNFWTYRRCSEELVLVLVDEHVDDLDQVADDFVVSLTI